MADTAKTFGRLIDQADQAEPQPPAAPPPPTVPQGFPTIGSPIGGGRLPRPTLDPTITPPPAPPPPAFPTVTNPRIGFDEPRRARLYDQFYLGASLLTDNPDEAHRTAALLSRLALTEPGIVAEGNRALAAALRVTDTEYLDRVRDADDPAGVFTAAFSILRDADQATGEVRQFIRERQAFTEAGKELDNSFFIVSPDAGLEAGLLPRGTLRDMAPPGINPDEFARRVAHRDERAIHLVQVAERAGNQPVTFAAQGRRLGVSLGSDNIFYDIILDPGVTITDTYDAYTAWVEAVYGTRHRIAELTRFRGDNPPETLNPAEMLPGRQTIFGRGAQLIGDSVGIAGHLKDRIDAPLNWLVAQAENAFIPSRDKGPAGSAAFRTSHTINLQRAAAQAGRQAELLGLNHPTVTPSDTLGALTVLALDDLDTERNGEGTILLAAGAALDFYDALPPEARDQLETDVLEAKETLSYELKDELLTEAQRAANSRNTNSIRRGLETTLSVTVDALSTYDGLIQRNLVNVVDALGDFGQAVAGLATGGSTGWQKFQDAWDTHHSEFISDYFGIEGTAGATLDFMGSLIGDPFLWVTPGGKGLLQAFTRRMTTRGGAEEFLRLPSTRVFVEKAVDTIETAARVGADDRVGAYVALQGGLEADRFNAFYRAVRAGNRAEADAVLHRALTEGLWLPNFSTVKQMRNVYGSAVKIANQGGGKAQRFLRRQLKVFARDARVRTTRMSFLDDVMKYVEAIRSIDPARADRIFTRALNLVDNTVDDASASIVARNLDRTQQGLTRIDQTLLSDPELAFFVRNHPNIEATNDIIDDLTARAASLEGRAARAEATGTLEPAAAMLTEADELRATARWLEGAHDEAARIRAQLHQLRANQRTTTKRLEPQAFVAERNRLQAELAAVRARQSEAGAVLLRSDLRRGTATYDDLSRRSDALRQERDAMRQARDRNRDLARTIQAGDGTDELRAFWEDTMEEVADMLGLDDAPGEFSNIVGEDGQRLTARNWAALHGEDPQQVVMTFKDLSKEEVDRFANLWLDPTLKQVDRDNLQAVARSLLGRQQGRMTLPASPMDIILYHQTHKTFPAWQKIRKVTHAEKIDDVLGFVNRVFAGNLLFNMRTFIRSNLDEPIRHSLLRGRWFGSRTGIRSISPLGATEAGRIASPARAAGRRLSAPFRRNLLPSDRATRAINKMTGAFDLYGAASDAAPIAYSKATAQRLKIKGAVVNRGEFNRQARMLFNGVLADDPLIKAYARAVIDGDGLVTFMEDWDRIADLVDFTPVHQVTEYGGSTTRRINSAREAYESLEQMGRVVDHNAGVNLWNDLLSHWAAGEPIPDEVLRRLGFVPGRLPAEGIAQQMFDGLYGRPGMIHTGAVFEDFYDQAADTLLTRLRNQGRYMDEDTLATYLADRYPRMTADDVTKMARDALQHGHEEIIAPLRRQGYYFPRDIDAAAEQWASRHAAMMQYHSGARSMLGRAAQRAFPFGPAQWEFMGFYLDQITQPATFGLNPTLRKALNTLPGVNIGAAARQVGAGAAYLPLNLRLAGRMAAIMGASATVHQNEKVLRQRGLDPDTMTPAALLDEYTFLPVNFSDSFWVDFMPGGGPWLSWALHLLPTDTTEDDGPFAEAAARLRDWSEGVFPWMEYEPGQTQMDPAALLGSVVDSILPRSRSSVRSLFEAGILTGAGIAGFGDLFVGPNAGPFWDLPPDFYPQFRGRVAEMLEADPLRSINDPGVPGVAPAFADEIDRLLNEELAASSMETLVNRLFKGFAVSVPAEYAARFQRNLGRYLRDTDAEDYLPSYEGLFTEMPWLMTLTLSDPDTGIPAPAVGAPQGQAFLDMWERFRQGELTEAEMYNLRDLGSDILFSLPEFAELVLRVRHPGVNQLYVTQFETTSFAPEEFSRNGRLWTRGMSATQARLIRQRGRDERWLRPREPAAVAADAYSRYAQAVSDLTGLIWSESTGLQSFTLRPSDPNGRVALVPIYAELVADLTGVDKPPATRRELAQLLAPIREAASLNATYGDNTNQIEVRLATDAYPFLQIVDKTRADINRLGQMAREGAGPGNVRMDGNDPTTWPDETRDLILNGGVTPDGTRLPGIRGLIDAQVLTEETYRQWSTGRWNFGDLDYTPPDPPPLGDPRIVTTINVEPADVQVVDGDTVRVAFADTERRIRLHGVNATEQPVEGETSLAWDPYWRQTQALQRVIDQADTVNFVVFDLDRFGAIHELDEQTGEFRFLMWLYVDGQPVWDPTVFTSDNPRGVMTGGQGVTTIPHSVTAEEIT